VPLVRAVEGESSRLRSETECSKMVEGQGCAKMRIMQTTQAANSSGNYLSQMR